MRIVANVELDDISASAGAQQSGKPSIGSFADDVESIFLHYRRKVLDLIFFI
jgi:hypothetical protein